MTIIFLHGLESSSKGSKAKWFNRHLPSILTPDFTGALDNRMDKLNSTLDGLQDVVLIGSSFGGLMATIYALENERRVKKVVLLAPALNFPDIDTRPAGKTAVPAHLYVGRQDTVCPPDTVLPVARQLFTNISVTVTNDDHFLHNTFTALDWEELLRG